MDYNGGSGKSTLSEILEHDLHFQLLQIHTSRDIACSINNGAGGYVFDLPRCHVVNEDFYILLERIKNRVIGSGKYKGTTARPQSNKVVVLANCFPNILALTMDRWKIFHPHPGEINVCCTQRGQSYFTTISTEMICRVQSRAVLSGDTEKTDEDLFAEFLELRTSSKHLIPLFSNKLAFPAIGVKHRRQLEFLIKEKTFKNASSYVKQHDLFKNSIAPPEFLQKCEMLDAVPIDNGGETFSQESERPLNDRG
jgi:hypothetical protein